MEYLHETSMPVSKSELQVFTVPPTQTAIESYYEVDYRPNSTLEGSTTYEINIPKSDDFTDMQATMVHLVVQIVGKNPANASRFIRPVENFGNSLFEQIDLAIGSVNTTQKNNMYHYQAYLEDLVFRPPNNVDSGREADESRSFGLIDLYFRLHLSICEQDKLLINGVPLTFMFTRSTDSFSLYRYDAKDTDTYKINFKQFAVHIKRVKLFSEAQLAIVTSLEKSPAKYFITRNETRAFTIEQGISSATIENVFIGPLPRRVLIGFVSDGAKSGLIEEDPYFFFHYNITYLALNIDGNKCPSIAYTPSFKEDLCMREFVNLYRYFNQDEGVPQLNLKYNDYKAGKTLFAFDLTPDGSIGGETGTLSLLKRGVTRLDIKLMKPLTRPIKAIVFAQYDNLITIDKDRNVMIDY